MTVDVREIRSGNSQLGGHKNGHDPGGLEMSQAQFILFKIIEA